MFWQLSAQWPLAPYTLLSHMTSHCTLAYRTWPLFVFFQTQHPPELLTPALRCTRSTILSSKIEFFMGTQPINHIFSFLNAIRGANRQCVGCIINQQGVELSYSSHLQQCLYRECTTVLHAVLWQPWDSRTTCVYLPLQKVTCSDDWMHDWLIGCMHAWLDGWVI